MKGKMICLEGGEGAGKSTAIRQIQAWLEARGRRTLVTREPGGTPVAERIREVVLNPATGDIDPMSELLLLFAARRENVVEVIQPALEQGIDVICDRFTDASYAYQGGGRALGPKPVDVLAGLVHPALRPDLVLLLDVPVELGLRRIRGRKSGPDRFEQTRVDFLQRVRETYLDRARSDPERYAVIDASKPINDVRAELEQALEAHLA